MGDVNTGNGSGSDPAASSSNEPGRGQERPDRPRLVVGLGASAGGLAALEEFFDGTPPHTGMAFVVVSHQHPNAHSLMPELLAKHTQMPVVTARDNQPLEADHVYVVPSSGYLTIADDWTLHIDRSAPGIRRHLPIDRFFRSAASSLRRHTAAVVLSGSGTDGTIGLKAVKSELGLTMAQDPNTAKYTGMPGSAIGTHQVDYVLPAAEMCRTLVAYAEALNGPPLISSDEHGPEAGPDAIRQILTAVRARTGHDFSTYKPSTIGRRIERRMNVHRLGNPSDYLEHLRSSPAEVDALFRELLIGVTSFFRDPEAFEALATQVIRPLVKSKPPNIPVRVWVCGCSTGEEAYSIAILLAEQMEALGERREVQIFATDLDASAISTARAGVYPVGVAEDVSPGRLSRYFVSEDGFYRISEEIRNMVVFAVQDVLSEPPFTRLDLLSCRNLLIYLDSAVQRELISMFHYAINPDGALFIGTAESLSTESDGFDVVDKRWNIYRRKVASATHHLRQPMFPIQGTDVRSRSREGLRSTSIFDLSDRILAEAIAPPSVIVDEQGRIAHIHGRTGKFLEPSPGAPEMNIFQMAREGLRTELMSALRQAVRRSEVIVRKGIEVQTNGETARVVLRVHPVLKPEAAAGHYVVSFEEVSEPQSEVLDDMADVDRTEGRVEELQRRLRATKETLDSTIEEYETANEELMSTNEELQSTNEELQSTNEELETAKEEQQSLNEELQTVNAELQEKMKTLSKAHDDMRNLLNSTNIATLFLDRGLRIKRYTQEARKIANLIESDVGRPISDLVTKLEYPELADEAQKVLETLEPRRLEVKHENASWYQMSITPYRTSDDAIDGVVLTFVDVTRLKHVEQERERERAAVRTVVEKMPVPGFLLDENLRLAVLNGRFLHRMGMKGRHMEGRELSELGHGWEVPRLQQQLLRHGRVEGEIVELELPERGRVAVPIDAVPIEDTPSGEDEKRRILVTLGDEAEVSGARDHE